MPDERQAEEDRGDGVDAVELPLPDDEHHDAEGNGDRQHADLHGRPDPSEARHARLVHPAILPHAEPVPMSADVSPRYDTGEARRYRAPMCCPAGRT
ncbi:hypothetical protein QP157_15240 [Sphingomonas sp. LR61]|uniref:hypothetical protein n=1 Tax=Sphingomonas sp. LR61 TaxID=3050234 RepID=UPI002FDF4653